MTSSPFDPEPGNETEPPGEAAWEAPQHGFPGVRRAAPVPACVPAGLTVAISREAGARGGTIARRVGRKLGWPVYHQELLDYIVQEASQREGIVEDLAPAAAHWVEDRLHQLLREQNLSQHPSVINLARVILTLGARGEAVLIGRGAGCILPRSTTLHVRIVALLADRIAYMSQWSRLTVDEAAEQVRLRDSHRATFIASHFHRQPGDIYQYDLLLNSSLLGEELCADLIAHAVRARQPPRDAS
jgi:cytidylate kinase